MYIHTHTYTHTYTCTYIHIHTHIHKYIHTHTYIHTNTYIHTYIHTHIHTHTTYTHTYTHTNTYIHTHIHTHTTCTHTYINTYIHTYTHNKMCALHFLERISIFSRRVLFNSFLSSFSNSVYAVVAKQKITLLSIHFLFSVTNIQLRMYVSWLVNGLFLSTSLPKWMNIWTYHR
jgi:hypothetical protein